VALYLIDNATVTINTVNIKFGRTIKISSLINSHFTGGNRYGNTSIYKFSI